MLGKSGAFYNENNTYLLPNISLANGSIGLPNGECPGREMSARDTLTSISTSTGLTEILWST